MTPLSITVVNHDGSTTTVPVIATPSGYVASLGDHRIHLDVVRTNPARTPAKCRFSES